MMGGSQSGLFGLTDPLARRWWDTPPYAPDRSIQETAPLPAPQPFTWGDAGSRVTPDMLAQRGKMAQGLIAAGMDTSPVGHWTQGLARVAQALVGTMQQNRVDKATMANADAERQILASITGGQGGDAASLAALSSPYLTEGAKDAIKLQWQATHRAPIQPTEFERALAGANILPGTPEYTAIMRDYATNKANPIQAVPGVDENGNQVLRFIRPNAMSQGGGDPASTVPRAPVGKLTPIGGAGSGSRTFP